MKVFHGSYTKISKIDLNKCEIGKDFGRGFYVTKIREQAEFWAKRKGFYNQVNGIVTEFNFNENAFQYFHFKTLKFEKYDEGWLDFVVKNRDVSVPQFAHDYDIVEGPVADDKIATRIKNYLGGEISKNQFLEELKFVRETHQICFCTGRSLQMLDYIDNTIDIDNEISAISESLVMQLMIDNHVNEIKATDMFYSSETFSKLADETSEFYLKSWQEIYEMLKHELN